MKYGLQLSNYKIFKGCRFEVRYDKKFNMDKIDRCRNNKFFKEI
jgi:hypothetical protein